MTCKNCQHHLSSTDKFCPNCGAEVITDRITLGSLWRDMAEKAFGWDNRYFITVKTLLFRPHILFKDYLGGTRKKYSNPFAFFAIAAALGLLVFGQFADDYVKMTDQLNEAQFESMEPFFLKIAQQEHLNALKDSTLSEPAELDFEAYKEQKMQETRESQVSMMKYYNFIAFLVLPLYALLAFLVYRKPHSYGEHLVMNAYIQGFLLLGLLVFFVISLFTSPIVYLSVFVFQIFYYLFAYGKLYELSFGQNVLKLIRFFVVGIGLFLAVAIVLFLFGVVIGFLRS